LLDSTNIFGTPSHDGTDEQLLQVSSNPHCGLLKSSNTQAGFCRENVQISKKSIGKSYIEVWLEECIVGAQDDNSTIQGSGRDKFGGALLTYDQATAGPTSPDHGEVVGDSFSGSRPMSAGGAVWRSFRYVMTCDELKGILCLNNVLFLGIRKGPD